MQNESKPNERVPAAEEGGEGLWGPYDPWSKCKEFGPGRTGDDGEGGGARSVGLIESRVRDNGRKGAESSFPGTFELKQISCEHRNTRTKRIRTRRVGDIELVGFPPITCESGPDGFGRLAR